jgi:hypothetical protein
LAYPRSWSRSRKNDGLGAANLNQSRRERSLS